MKITNFLNSGVPLGRNKAGNDLVMGNIILWLRRHKQRQTMNKLNAPYQSYLLRLWQDGPQARWHASVQSVQNKEIIHFVCLEDLVSFLWTQTGVSEPKNGSVQEVVSHPEESV